MSLTATDIDRMLAEARAKAAAAWNTMKAAPLRTQVDTGNAGPLTMVAASYGKRPDLAHLHGDDLIAALRESGYTEVTLTEDGGFVGSPPQWETDDINVPVDRRVYYERWTPEGMVAHGYVHPETRRLVQSG